MDVLEEKELKSQRKISKRIERTITFKIKNERNGSHYNLSKEIIYGHIKGKQVSG